MTLSRCRCGYRCAPESNLHPWLSSPDPPGAPPPDSCPEGRDQTAALPCSPDTYPRSGHMTGGSQIFHPAALSMHPPTHPPLPPSIRKCSLCDILPPQLTAPRARPGEDKALNQRPRAPRSNADTPFAVRLPEASGACHPLGTGSLCRRGCRASHKALGLSPDGTSHDHIT